MRTTHRRYGIHTDLDQLIAQAAATTEHRGTDVLENHTVRTLAKVGGMPLDIVVALVTSLYLVVDGPRFLARSLLGGYLPRPGELGLIVASRPVSGPRCSGCPSRSCAELAGLFELVPMFGPLSAGM
jgi:hypothetical protein